MDKMEIWNKVKQPPLKALKKIKGGRIGGMTDINPQWRCQIMTEMFGMIGVGWTYRTVRLWCEVGAKGEICAFAEIAMSVCIEGEWSADIPGNGGSMLVANEKNGPHTSDEAYKMATTDALSVAMKQLGVAADIYLGNFDGSKYLVPSEPPKPLDNTPIDADELKRLCTIISKNPDGDMEKFDSWIKTKYNVDSKKDIPKRLFKEILSAVEKK